MHVIAGRTTTATQALDLRTREAPLLITHGRTSLGRITGVVGYPTPIRNIACSLQQRQAESAIGPTSSLFSHRWTSIQILDRCKTERNSGCAVVLRFAG